MRVSVRRAGLAVARAFKRLVGALLVMVILLVGTMAQPSVEPMSDAETGGLRVGIAYGNTLWGMSDDALAQALDDAVDIGAGWIRADLSWADVQPNSPQQFVWEPFDRVVDQARQRDLDVLPILSYTPAWARRPDCSTSKCAPADPAQFAQFAGAAAKRYDKRGVHAWEIWNEPNSAGFWQPSADPVAYTRLLQASAEAIRAAQPNGVVVLGGLATLSTGSGNTSVADFLLPPGESPLRFVDVLAVHPYTFPIPSGALGPWASPRLPADSGLPYLRQVLAAAGVPHLPIWITEYGAPTGGPGVAWGESDSLSGNPDHVTEPQQAAIAFDAVGTAASGTGTGALFWYTDRDLNVSGEDTTENYYGLRRADGTQKPAFAAIRDAVRNSRP